MGLYCASVDGVALVAATAKTLLELGSTASVDAWVKEWWVEFDGATSTAVPVKIEVGSFSAAVTTATTLAGFKWRYTSQPTASTVLKHSTTVEGAGTASNVVIHRISPTSGYHYISPLGQEFGIAVSTFWRLRCTAPAGVNASFGVIWEE